jgi:hypothetical protein
MKSVAELEREADRRKVQFETKVDEIKRRLMPQRLADEALRAISLPGTAATDAVVDTARRNPLLVLALAAGAGWFFVMSRQKVLGGSKRTHRNHKRMKEIGYVNSRR